MLEKYLSSYIVFGATLFYLQTVRDGHTLAGEGRVLENIDGFLRNLNELGLVVTQRTTHKLKALRAELVKGEAKELTREQAKRLGDIADTIRSTLLAEAGGMVAYIVSERRF